MVAGAGSPGVGKVGPLLGVTVVSRRRGVGWLRAGGVQSEMEAGAFRRVLQPAVRADGWTAGSAYRAAAVAMALGTAVGLTNGCRARIRFLVGLAVLGLDCRRWPTKQDRSS